MSAIQNHDLVICRVKLRDSYKGRAIKPRSLALNGALLALRAEWLQKEDDLYPGEWELRDPKGCRWLMETFGVQYISSGDVEVLYCISYADQFVEGSGPVGRRLSCARRAAYSS